MTNSRHPQTWRRLTGIIYAMGYPFGCVAPIAVIVILVRKIFRIKLAEELGRINAEAGGKLSARSGSISPIPIPRCVLADIKPLRELGLVVGKMLRGDEITPVTAHTRLQLGDVLLVVGPEEKLTHAQTLFGPKAGTICAV